MVKGNKANLLVRLGLGVALAFGAGSCGTRPNLVSLNIPREHIQFFTCNYWEDLEPYNDKTDYPEEFVGMKNKFKKGEKLELVLGLPISGIAGRNLNVVVYDSKEEVVFVDSSKIPVDGATYMFGRTKINLMDTILERGGLGEYKAVAYIDKSFAGSHKFKITE